MRSLTVREAFKSTATDKHRSHNYEQFYAYVFTPAPKSILEIGVKEGRSLAAWRMLFPTAKISGIDITDKNFIDMYIKFAEADISILDSTKRGAADSFESYDVVIDDGSHFYKDIIDTFENFKDKFNNYYVIEDAMYEQEQIISYIKSCGFSDVTMLPSITRNVVVDRNFVEKNSKEKSGETVSINLYMIVVKR